MIMGEIILAGAVIGLLRGGSIRNLAREPLRGEWALFVLLFAQLSWPSVAAELGLPCGLSVVAWLLFMSGLALVLMMNSRRRLTLAFAALGIAMNILVIGLNQAMPVSIKSASEMGISREEARVAFGVDCLHEELDEDSLAPFLADVIVVPGPPWHRSVLSLGDLLLAGGLGAWVCAASRGQGRATR